MFATASAPSTRNSSRSGPSERLERVGGDRRAVALDLDRRRLDAVDVGHRELDEREAVARRRDDPATLLPRVARGDHEHAVEAERLAHLGGHDDVTECTGIERAAEHSEPLRSLP